jgi:hypothetical protein
VLRTREFKITRPAGREQRHLATPQREGRDERQRKSTPSGQVGESESEKNGLRPSIIREGMITRGHLQNKRVIADNREEGETMAKEATQKGG